MFKKLLTAIAFIPALAVGESVSIDAANGIKVNSGAQKVEITTQGIQINSQNNTATTAKGGCKGPTIQSSSCNGLLFREPTTQLDVQMSEMTDTHFSQTRLHNSIFSSTDLSQSRFEKVQIESTQFKNTTLEEAELSQVQFNDVQFTLVDLSDARLVNVDFGNSTFNDVSFSGASLSNVSFANSQIDVMLLEDAELIHVILPDGQACASTEACKAVFN